MDIYDPLGKALGITPMQIEYDFSSYITEPIPAWNKGINHFGSKENHPWFGKTHTEESKNKISKSHKGLKASEETKAKMSAAHMGRKSALGMLGKTHSEETKAKMRQSALNRKLNKN